MILCWIVCFKGESLKWLIILPCIGPWPMPWYVCSAWIIYFSSGGLKLNFIFWVAAGVCIFYTAYLSMSCRWMSRDSGLSFCWDTVFRKFRPWLLLREFSGLLPTIILSYLPNLETLGASKFFSWLKFLTVSIWWSLILNPPMASEKRWVYGAPCIWVFWFPRLLLLNGFLVNWFLGVYNLSLKLPLAMVNGLVFLFASLMKLYLL